MSRRDINNQDQIALEASLELYRAAACAEADAVFDDRALEQQREQLPEGTAAARHGRRERARRLAGPVHIRGGLLGQRGDVRHDARHRRLHQAAHLLRRRLQLVCRHGAAL